MPRRCGGRAIAVHVGNVDRPSTVGIGIVVKPPPKRVCSPSFSYHAMVSSDQGRNDVEGPRRRPCRATNTERARQHYPPISCSRRPEGRSAVVLIPCDGVFPIHAQRNNIGGRAVAVHVGNPNTESAPSCRGSDIGRRPKQQVFALLGSFSYHGDGVSWSCHHRDHIGYLPNIRPCRQRTQVKKQRRQLVSYRRRPRRVSRPSVFVRCVGCRPSPSCPSECRRTRHRHCPRWRNVITSARHVCVDVGCLSHRTT